MHFADKVAVVTGSGQGIGAAYARGLAAEGAAVAAWMTGQIVAVDGGQVVRI